MRAAKIAKLAHGFNAYFFIHIFMFKSSKSSTNSMLAKTPFYFKSGILSFVLGKEEATLVMQDLHAIRQASIAPSAAALSSAAAAEPEPSAAAEDVSFANSL